ncbi:uncharacterized protein LOC113375838 [Ctenocephalides felis]|uniref:uncharacterized protein LOC113375837 n=1 Tax=Ctenocephalides felis TaxID=7515 RepID=UPI000E6E4BDA|nr:uncharacterized protein LOC113375837 [Ctenocephalides felis]XP_026471571.1 uncharacterized protein LOC113375838 [Ctenocephalides felis]
MESDTGQLKGRQPDKNPPTCSEIGVTVANAMNVYYVGNENNTDLRNSNNEESIIRSEHIPMQINSAETVIEESIQIEDSINMDNVCDKSNEAQNIEMTEQVPSDENFNRINVDEIHLPNRFDMCDTGPFYIYVESLSKNIGRLHPMALGKLLHRSRSIPKEDFLEIIVIDNNKVKLVLRNGKTANSLLDDSFFADNKLKAYIPKYLLIREGIIFDVDINLTAEEILEEIESVIPIIDVKCFVPKNINKRRINSQFVNLSFRGSILPDKVGIHSVKCPVSPFIKKITQCHKCYRFGHVREKCRNDLTCPKYAGPHIKDVCIEDNNYLCCLCKDNHEAYNKDCRIYKRYKNINELMAKQNLSFYEAKKNL